MDICSDNHDEVCYGGGFGDCPVCNMRDAMQGEIDGLLLKIEDIEKGD